MTLVSILKGNFKPEPLEFQCRFFLKCCLEHKTNNTPDSIFIKALLEEKTPTNKSLHVSRHYEWIGTFVVIMTSFGHSDISAISDITIPLKKKMRIQHKKKALKWMPKSWTKKQPKTKKKPRAPVPSSVWPRNQKNLGPKQALGPKVLPPLVHQWVHLW